MSDKSDEMKLLEAQLKDQTQATQKLRDRLEQMKRAEADKKLEPLKATAARAHDLLCPFNHDDGCSWHYEGENWKASEHSRWLQKIDTLINGSWDNKPTTTLEELNIVLDAMADLKPKVKTALSLIRRGLMP